MNGLFIGLTTLDFIYLSDRVPQANEKRVALDQMISAGGPATNAAITFCYGGNRAKLFSSVGSHPLNSLIHQELETYGVTLLDLTAEKSDPPPTSSIIVTQSTGERAVISLNATQTQVQPHRIPPNILDEIDIVLIDGHQMAVSAAIAKQAKAKKIPIVVDGGSWKSGFESVLGYCDYGIVSSHFYPPGCHQAEEIIAYLRSQSINQIAITQGEKPIIFWDHGEIGEIPVQLIQTVDTLGAGDIFHGAFCDAILQIPFREALDQAAQTAALSCQFFGSRRWIAIKKPN